MNNILTQPFHTPLNAAPFPLIKNADYLPAFKMLLAEGEQEIEKIANNTEPAGFENTIEAIAYAGQQLDIASGIFFNLNSAETNDEMQEIAKELSPLLSAYSSKISQNKALFNRIKTVFDNRKNLRLNAEQEMLLELTYKGFVRSGALLNEEDKKKLEELNKELSLKSLQFGQNVLAATNAYSKHIPNKEELKGIPGSVLAQYAEEAKEKNLEGYIITLQHPSIGPALKYADNRELRKELALANGRKSFAGDEYDNRELIADIIRLRQEKAAMLGYKDFAEFVLEERMAESPAKVRTFLDDLLKKAKPYAQHEIESLRKLAEADGITELHSYDHAYYAEKLRKEKFDIDDEELKPYFSLHKVQDAVFDLAGKLFGLTFTERQDIPVYHEDVKVYEVKENGIYKALLYADYHPRKGKRAGAWMTSYRNQYKEGGNNIRPHISVVCNFSKPTADTPSLLTFQEVTTLFHEFGHALHGILADTQYPSLSGTSVKWDFVELPSQFLENYCYEAAFLKTFAKHYKTGEVLPDDKIEKLSASKSFMEGYQTLRQIGFGLLDIAYHSNLFTVGDVKTFEVEETKATQLYPANPETAVSTSFSHIFQGGYAAGYYSYKWAEVLDADAFQYFKEHGIFDKTIAEKYKTLLSKGGTENPMKLYKDFRGSEPKVESLLKRAFG